MFGSSSRKQSASTTLWAVQILTTEFLVEGSFQPDKYKSGGQNVFEMASQTAMDGGGADAFQYLHLSQATVRPTGNSTMTPQSFSEWNMSAVDTVVAIIPGDEASLQVAQKAFKDYRHPVPVVVYAGPYVIRAKLMSDSGDRNRSPFAMTELLPLTDAEIDCPLAGAQLKGFRVPWLLLKGTRFLHGYGVE